MVFCKTLNKEYATRDDLFAALKLNESKILSIKKAQLYESSKKNQISINGAYLKNDIAEKAGLSVESGYVYPVINTTRYYDSHEDVHFDGIWKKTITEQKDKIHYVLGHKFNVDNVIAWPQDVDVFTKKIDWSMVGKDYPGQTEALIFKILESDLKKQSAIDAIKERRPVQGSVSMRYIKITMAINSDNPEYKDNKKYWDSHINLIANKDDIIDGYFYGVDEAAIAGEGSMVLIGSNDATEIIYPESEQKTEPEKSTQQDNEPQESTQRKFYLSLLKNN